MVGTRISDVLSVLFLFYLECFMMSKIVLLRRKKKSKGVTGAKILNEKEEEHLHSVFLFRRQ